MRNIQVSLVGEQPGGAIQGLRVSPSFDHLVLLHGGSEKSKVAAHEAKATAEMLVSPTEIEVIEVDPFGMGDVLAKISGVRKRNPEARITVNLSGGTNIMAGAALLGCFILGAEGFYIKYKRDEPPGPIEDRLVRLTAPRVVLEDVKGKKLRILRALLGARATPVIRMQGDVAKELKMSAQLMSNHVKKLERWKLVAVTPRGRSKELGLTDSGLLFAQLAD